MVPRQAWCQQCMQSSREESSSHPKRCLGIEPGRRWGQDGLGQENCGCAGHVGVFRTSISILSKVGEAVKTAPTCVPFMVQPGRMRSRRQRSLLVPAGPLCSADMGTPGRASGRDKLCPPRLGRGQGQVFLIGTLSSHGPSSALGGSFSPQAQQP